MDTEATSFRTRIRDPRTILWRLKVFDRDGKRLRAPTRADLQAVLEANSGMASPVRFDKLDLRGADLRGLDLRGTSFKGSDLSGAIASPLVIDAGDEMDSDYHHDGFVQDVVDRWERGDKVDLESEGIVVKPTKLQGSILNGAILKRADFRFAFMRNCRLRDVDAEGAIFYGANLESADLRFG